MPGPDDHEAGRVGQGLLHGVLRPPVRRLDPLVRRLRRQEDEALDAGVLGRLDHPLGPEAVHRVDHPVGRPLRRDREVHDRVDPGERAGIGAGRELEEVTVGEGHVRRARTTAAG